MDDIGAVDRDPSLRSGDPLGATQRVALRPMPFPYEAGISICSDIDDTGTRERFLAIQEYLCTNRETSLGPGLGLEIGNSFFPYPGRDRFSWYSGDPEDRDMLRTLIRAGYVDCLHTYGEQALTRDQAARAIDDLSREDCWLEVWINHNGAVTNLGQKLAYLFDRADSIGSLPGSAAYHADLSSQYGIRFAWVGAGTRRVGQSAALQELAAGLRPLDMRHPVASSWAGVKQAVKETWGRLGNERYSLQATNDLIAPLALEDGTELIEFVRYCDHHRGIPYGASADGLAEVISRSVIDRLRLRQGLMIVYTHLGQSSDPSRLLPLGTQRSLEYLAGEHRAGRVWVTTTARLLRYEYARKHAIWKAWGEDHSVSIGIEGKSDTGQRLGVADLQGMTFTVPRDCAATVEIDGVPVREAILNPPDVLGQPSISIPLEQSEYPL